MRINCAHDGPEQWAAMVENLRHAERTVGRSCKVQADLAGPKLRTGHLLPAGHVLKIKPQRDIRGKVIAPGQVWLTPSGAEEPAPERRSGASRFLRASSSWMLSMVVHLVVNVRDAMGANTINSMCEHLAPAVEELTGRLRAFDPGDPVRYDFALFGLGSFEKF